MQKDKPNLDFCIITEQFLPSSTGIGNSSYELALVLIKNGHTVSIVTKHLPGCKKFETIDGMHIYRLGGIEPDKVILKYIYYAKFFCLSLIKILCQLKPQYVLGQTAWSGGFIATLAGKISPNIVSIVHTHGQPNLCNKIFILAKISYFLADKVFTTNQKFKNLVQDLGVNKPIFVVSNIVREPSISELEKQNTLESYKFNPQDFNIVLVGRLDFEFGLETKGFSYAIKALPLLAGVKLHVFGTGSKQAWLEALARQYGVAHKIMFYGQVERSTVLYLEALANCILVPSLSEGMSLTMLDAMVLRIPIISTQTAGAADVLVDNQNALLIAKENPQSIAQAVKTLQGDPALARELTARAYDTYLNNFTPHKVYQDLMRALAS